VGYKTCDWNSIVVLIEKPTTQKRMSINDSPMITELTEEDFARMQRPDVQAQQMSMWMQQIRRGNAFSNLTPATSTASEKSEHAELTKEASTASEKSEHAELTKEASAASEKSEHAEVTQQVPAQAPSVPVHYFIPLVPMVKIIVITKTVDFVQSKVTKFSVYGYVSKKIFGPKDQQKIVNVLEQEAVSCVISEPPVTPPPPHF
jgi:transposase-like protein